MVVSQHLNAHSIIAQTGIAPCPVAVLPLLLFAGVAQLLSTEPDRVEEAKFSEDELLHEQLLIVGLNVQQGGGGISLLAQLDCPLIGLHLVNHFDAL